MDSFPDLYPLTSLQIGDVKSSLSQAFLYFAPISHKFLILVDNESWWKNKHSKSTCIRELMITKYRMSPFKNNRTLPSGQIFGCSSTTHPSKNLHKWLPTINLASLRDKASFSLINLYEALHGFIVFEVVWKDVRGMNYLNELQNDASLALEVKALKKWEFISINQALSSVTSWFSGTQSEMQTLRSNLVLLFNKIPSRCSLGVTVSSKELLFDDASQAELFSEDLFFDVRECPSDTIYGKIERNNDIEFESVEYYRDTFLLLKFNDKDLPFKLQQIITCDLKLLALLEAGLPPWVIFLQSYPVICKVYSPWMPPLLSIFYILVSFITVIIGFYDLYKNIPLLKAAMSMSLLCGPFFRWIEAWDRISRIRYLGTMLFLQNLEKAIKWFLRILRVLKLPVLVLMKPLTHPLGEIVQLVTLTPIWRTFAEMGTKLYIITCVLVPLKLLCTLILNLVTMVSALLKSMWKLFLLSTRGCLALANHVATIFFGIYQVLDRAFMNTSNTAGSMSRKMSLWHSLWNDLFSKVFTSLRNIIQGLVTFFTSCNIHRQSIYNHLKAIFWWVCCLVRLAPRAHPCHQVPHVESQYHKMQVDVQKCDCCKRE